MPYKTRTREHVVCLARASMKKMILHTKRWSFFTQTESDTRRSLVQPPAWSKVSCEVRSGCLGFCVVVAWKFPHTETKIFLGSLFACLSLREESSFLAAVRSSHFEVWQLHPLLQLCTTVKSLPLAFPQPPCRCCESALRSS